MALPHLIKYIYNSGTDEVIRRGKKIHSFGYVELIDYDEFMQSVNFRVKDDAYSTYYKVSVQKFDSLKTLSVRCTCPYNLGDICRHEAAALFQLQDLVDRNLLATAKTVTYNQKHTVIKIKFIDLKVIRMLTGPDNFNEAEELLRTNKINILSAANERVEAEMEAGGHVFPIIIQKNEERNFDTSCTCDETMHALCKHKTALFLQLLNAHGPNYFDTIRDWDKEKNKLLELYGYNLNEELTGKFEFIYKDGKPFLKVLDPSIKKITAPQKSAPSFSEPENPPEVLVAQKSKRIGIVFNYNQNTFPFFTIDAVQGDYDEEQEIFIGRVEKLDIMKFINLDLFCEADKQVILLIRKLQQAEINKYLNRNSPFSGFWENIIHSEGEELTEETRILITEFIHPKLKKLFLSGKVFLYLPKGKKFTTENLENIFVSTEAPVLYFDVTAQEDEYVLSSTISVGGDKLRVSGNQWNNYLLLLYDGEVFLWDKTEDALIAKKFNSPLHIPKEEWPVLLKDVVLPLTKDYKVNFDRSLIRDVKEGEPDITILLVERGDYLSFQPVFSYKGFNVKPDHKENIIVPDNDKILQVHRNIQAEKDFVHRLEGLHSQFSHKENDSLILKGTDVLKNNWFFLFIDTMKEWKVPVYGFNALKNFRFNTAKPATHIHLSSGLDWFDARVELSFGEQRIGVSEIKKALSNKQSFVQLNDGTLGILPEEWINKYALLFKVGQGKDNKLKLSKFHLSVIDDLYENRDETEIQFELDEKYDRLRNFKSIPETDVPKELRDKLRPYQIAGLHWLHYLNSVGWGGILADDMGLGKTVQALSMLRHYEQENHQLKALVVCPTTLIYNWENEIKKFTPSLSWYI
ncbi:MAG TPA: SNF2-related protein, partial [Chitinophagaceae bacterium]|nr:SNF2-related protein [Chitinophagaceae bacterium]